jgi:hypothetical protein
MGEMVNLYNVVVGGPGRKRSLRRTRHTRVYPKVAGLATWSENCK